MSHSESREPRREHPRFRRSIVVLLLIVAAAGILGALALRRPAGERSDLEARIGAAASLVGSGGIIDLTGVTDFEWDQAVVFAPYSSQQDIRAALGFDWVPASPAEAALMGNLILASDEESLIVFLNTARAVVAWAILGGPQSAEPSIQFSPSGTDVAAAAYSRAEARFTVTDLRGELADSTRGGWQLSPAP